LASHAAIALSKLPAKVGTPATAARLAFLNKLTRIWNGDKDPLIWGPDKRDCGKTWEAIKDVQVPDFENIAVSFLNGEIQMMAFIGRYGTGKTTAAHAIMFGYQYNNFEKETFGAEMLDWYELGLHATNWASHYSQRADAGARELKRLIEMPLLVIDEFGMSRPPENQFNFINHLLNRRYALMKSTLVLTTASLSTLKQNVGGGIVDRLSGERTGGKVVEFNGKPWRQA
jgi:DNA replication protein DnaC